MSHINWGNLNKEERAKLVRFYLLEKRWSYDRLAGYLNVSRNVIAGICNRHDIKIPRDRPKVRPSTPDPTADNVILFPLLSKPAREEAVGDMAKKLKAKKHSHNHGGAVHAVNSRISYNNLPPDEKPDLAILKADIWKPLPGSSPVDITRIGNEQCRWPVSDDNHSMCHEPVKHGKVYCVAHCAVAYKEAPPIKFRKRRHG